MGPQAVCLSSRTTLNDGVSMPQFGLGVGNFKDELVCCSSVYHALKHGYRMVDTAEYYGNEDHVGQAVNTFLNDEKLSRQDVFIVTKLWNYNHGREACFSAANAQLERLKVGAIDLYLMHSPLGGKLVETYRAMLELKEMGKVRSVGVSNFGIQHLDGLAAAGLPPPSVNQIELHPWQRKEPIVQYCQEKGITVMGYSPLAKGKKLDSDIIAELAERYGKTKAQVLIRYSIQMGYITIPKSENKDRIVENTHVFDFKLSDEDMRLLNTLPTWSCTWDPTMSDWIG